MTCPGTHTRHCRFSTPQLIANDTGNPANCCSVATVTIDLIDTNDHFPEFPQSIYSLNVMENSPEGTVIAPNITVRHRAGHSAAPGQGAAGAGHRQGLRCGEKVAAGWGTLHPSGLHFWGAHCPRPVPQVPHHPGG